VYTRRERTFADFFKLLIAKDFPNLRSRLQSLKHTG